MFIQVTIANTTSTRLAIDNLNRADWYYVTFKVPYSTIDVLELKRRAVVTLPQVCGKQLLIIILLSCIALFCIVLSCIVLYCIVLYCIVLYYITLHWLVMFCCVELCPIGCFFSTL